MVAALAAAGLSDVIKLLLNKRKDQKGAAGLEQLAQQMTAGQGQDMPSAQQAGAMSRAADPLAQLLGGQQGPAPQQSAIPTQQIDPAQQQAIARAQALQAAQGGSSGIEQLLGETDPLRQQKLEAGDQNIARSGFDLQQLIKQGAAADQLGDLATTLPNMENADPEALKALIQANPKTAPAELLRNLNRGSRDIRGIGNVSPNQYTPESVERFRETGNYADLQKAPNVEEIGGIKYSRNPITGQLQSLGVDQLGNISATEDAAKSGALNATMFKDLDAGRVGRSTSLKNLTDLKTAIESGELGTGVIEGRAQLPNEMKELLVSEQTKAAREALKEAGEIRPTDADVTQMREAMFGPANTEAFNIRSLDAAIKYNQDQEAKYQNLLKYRTRRGLSMPTANPATEAFERAAAEPRNAAPKATRRYNRETGQLEAIQ